MYNYLLNNNLFIKCLKTAINLSVLGLCCLHLPATCAPTDPQTEQQLDDYVQLLIDNQKAEAIAKLEHVLARLQDNTPINSKVRALSYHIREHLMYEQPKLALQQAEQLMLLAQASEQQEAVTEALMTLFNVLMVMKEQSITAPMLQQADMHTVSARLQQKLSGIHNPRLLFVGHTLLARMYSDHNSDYEAALRHYITAYEVVQNTHDNMTAKRLIFLDEHLCRIHLSLQNPTKAYTYIKQAIDGAIRNNVKLNLSMLYLIKSHTEDLLQQPEQELHSLLQGLHWAEQMLEHDTALSIMNNIGLNYQENKQYDKAKTILGDALKLAETQHDTYNIHNIRMSLGDLLIDTGAQVQGIEFIEQSLPYFRQLLDKAGLQMLLGEVADSYQRARRYQEQSQLLLEQRSLREEVFQAERDKRITELQLQFDTREEAQQARLLHQENLNKERLLDNKQLQHNFILLFALTMTLVAVLLWMLYRQSRLRSYRLYKDNKQLHNQSIQDPLTGLFNRRALMQKMHTDSRPSPHHTQATMPLPDVFLLMDIDHFKQLNDQHGHAVGDAVLIDIGRRLSQMCRGADILVRWGGEEFLLYLPQTDMAVVPALAKRVLDTISATPVIVDKLRLYVSLTGGVACSFYPGMDEDAASQWEQVVQLADAALYYGKQQGRNRICCVEQLQLPLSDTLARLAATPLATDTMPWLSIQSVCGSLGNPPMQECIQLTDTQTHI